MKGPEVKPSSEWEPVPAAFGSAVRRIPVPGGWLYQVETSPGYWHPPVWVTDHERALADAAALIERLEDES